MTYTRKEFISKISPIVVKEYLQTGRILPSLTIAQAILESGDGNSRLTKEANALFGIKSNRYWSGKVWTGNTVEYYDGVATVIKDGFRAYDSWEESIKDHIEFLCSLPRYKNLIGDKDYVSVCKKIYLDGYATDPNYSNKLIAIIRQEELFKYDIKEDTELFKAVQKIIKQGFKIEFNKWKRLDLINLNDVPKLLARLGGIPYMTKIKVIGQPEKWEKHLYTKEDVRSLLIKYAKTF